MTRDADFEDINEAKANMDYIYNQSDPRAYFRELKKLDYAIPEVAKPIFQKLITALQRRRDDTVHVLDLGCSYGVNGRLLNSDASPGVFGVNRPLKPSTTRWLIEASGGRSSAPTPTTSFPVP